MKDPYSVLGAKKGDDPQELLRKYNDLREKYDAERKLSGDAGNDGKRKLRELDEAWYEITEEIGEVKACEPKTSRKDNTAEKSDKNIVDDVKSTLSDLDKELDEAGNKLKNSSFGRSISEIGNSLGRAADDFMNSIFGKKKK